MSAIPHSPRYTDTKIDTDVQIIELLGVRNPKSSSIGIAVMEPFNGPQMYQPLQGSDIRVVKFRSYSPALDNYARIEAKLYHVPLDTSADFFASSYAQGDPNSTTMISLDGSDFPVTNNLWQAIMYLRNRFNTQRKHHDKILPRLTIDERGECDNGWLDYAICWWIDAICLYFNRY